MTRTFQFEGEPPLLFDDSRSVKELIQYAFDEFGYYEPAGMELVTLFQPQARTDTGWFTTDTGRPCADEIEIRKNLCFAYSMPKVFYFAEGGWGHHMLHLGNHPPVDTPVMLHLRFEDFDHSVVINGTYTFEDIINFLKQYQYLPEQASELLIRAINPHQNPYRISFDSPLLRLPLTEFEKKLPNSVVVIDIC